MFSPAYKRRLLLSVLASILTIAVSLTVFPAKRSLAVVLTYDASTTWQAPLGVTSVTVEVWGGGGGGGAARNSAGSGGGGGGYAQSVVTVIPGVTYTVTVGSGGAGGAAGNPGSPGTSGGPSWFNTTGTVFAAGGAGGAIAGGTAGVGGGSGGAGGTNIGTTAYTGGSGGAGTPGTRSGAGGGGAGSGAGGGTGGSGASGGAAGAGGSPDGGAGGAGTNVSGTANVGNTFGGGGSGAFSTSNGAQQAGGTGARGQVRLTFEQDTTPPTPNPVFATAPISTTTSAVYMVSQVVTDATSSPVSYFFTTGTDGCGSNGGTGGTSSGWQTAPNYNDTALQPNKCYSYTVTARDSVNNTTATSTASSTYTQAAAPGEVTYSSVTTSSLRIFNTENGNPASNPVTTFSVYVLSSDSGYANRYLTATAGTSTSPVWLTDAQIDNLLLTGLPQNTLYEFDVVAKNELGFLTATSTRTGTTTLIDVTPPSPNPPSFSSAPTNNTGGQLAMTSVTLTDALSSPVAYYFSAVTGSCGADAGAGGASSGWQSSTTYTDGTLQANKCYAYTITGRDAVGNITSTSSASSTYTSANIPGQLVFSDVGLDAFTITNDANGNPTSNPVTTFAVYASSTDASWHERYVNSSGNPTPSKTWLTDTQIDGLVIDGLTTDTSYSFVVLARNADGDETASSTLATVTTIADSTAPTPNPISFAPGGSPTNVTASQIDMTSLTAVDSSLPVSYYFTSVTGSCGTNVGTGGTDSGWQVSDPTYSDTGLQPNQCYAYTITTRDNVNNTTTASAASSTYTSANVPGALVVSSITATSFVLTNTENGNPAANPVTTFAVHIESTTPTDASHDGQYLDASGAPSGTAVWLTDTQIDNLTIPGLEPSTAYTLRVKARNADNDETAFGASVVGTTDALLPSIDFVRLQGVRLQNTILR